MSAVPMLIVAVLAFCAGFLVCLAAGIYGDMRELGRWENDDQ